MAVSCSARLHAAIASRSGIFLAPSAGGSLHVESLTLPKRGPDFRGPQRESGMTPIAIGVIPLESGPAFARAELLDLYRLYVFDQPVNLLLHFLLRQWTGSILTAHGGLLVHEGETPNRHLAGAVRSRGLGAVDKLSHLLFGEDTAILLRKRGQVGGLLL